MAESHLSIDARTLARFVPISELSEAHRAELAKHASVLSLNENQHLKGGDQFSDQLLFVLDGSVELSGGDYPDETLTAHQPAARFALSGMDSRERDAAAVEATRLLQVDRAKASTLLIWGQSGTDTDEHTQVREQAEIAAMLLDSPLFAQVPQRNLQEVAEHVERIDVKAGDTVLSQGEKGDHYYVLQSGRCEVLRTEDDRPPIRINELGPGASFGEEAILTDSPRNASVRMLSDGALLKLSGDRFLDLICTALLDLVSHERAEDLAALGARWLDVRSHEEFTRDGLDNALNLPLASLRARAHELSKDVSYVTYCDSGRRAKAAAFLLAQRGFTICCLRNGIGSKRPIRRFAQPPNPGLPGLQAELARTDAALEDAIQDAATAQAEQAVRAQRQSPSRQHPESEQRLQQAIEKSKQAAEVLERVKAHKMALDQKLREAEAHAASQRRHAEARCERMRQDTQALLEQVKQRLASQYREASDRLSAIDEARSMAEERFEQERLRLHQEFDKTRQRIEQEASRIRANMETARRGAEEKAEQIRARHMQQEQEVRRDTEALLSAERQRLEDEVARSTAAHKQAQEQVESTEALQRQAESDARRDREQRAAAERSRQERERLARVAAENRLRSERAVAVNRLEEARKAREDAERRRAEFAQSVMDASSSADEVGSESSIELEELDEQLRIADDELAEAEAAHDDAAEAAEVAEEVAATARQKEDELRLQLYEEMEQFISEEEEKSKQELQETTRYTQELDRIQADKERRRLETEKSTATMFEELQKALNDGEELDPFTFDRQRMVAEEKARLVQSARQEAAARTRAARDAVKGQNDGESTDAD